MSYWMRVFEDWFGFCLFFRIIRNVFVIEVGERLIGFFSFLFEWINEEVEVLGELRDKFVGMFWIFCIDD